MNGSDQIEDRLRSALRAEADGLRLAPDPWQENQRRVAAATSRRGRRVLGIAAALLAVATVLGAGALLGGGGSGGVPAGGPEDPFRSEFLLGPPVEAETLSLDGVQTVHTIALSDTTGQGPNLCERYESVGAGGTAGAGSSGSGGCTPRDPAADDPEVAFDWLAGTEGEGDVRGVTAAVDERVSRVRIWMDNGDMLPARLYPTGWEGTQMFALTTQQPDAPTAQRLVAYGRDGNVLQTVDVAARFGDEWLTRRSACAGDRVAESVPDGDVLPNAYVALGTSDASISVRTSSDTSAQTCLDRLRGSALAGWFAPGDSELVVLVVGPEVERVAVSSPGTGTTRAEPQSLPGTPWKVAVVRARNGERFDNPAEAVAYDLHGLELDREFLVQPSSP